MDDFRVYLHGAPGSPRELDLFGEARPYFHYAPDRFGADVPLCDLTATAHDIDQRSQGAPIHLVGFSMGGHIALEVAHRLGQRICRIDLIAAAAPLDSGEFLKLMAGAPLFAAARNNDRWFGVLVSLQALLSRFAPGLLMAMLFARCQGLDRALIRDPQFKQSIRAILRTTMAHQGARYRTEIKQYVSNWSGIVPLIETPTMLWHGTEDNWTPFAMARYFRVTLPSVIGIKAVCGASHYSALQYALAHLMCGPQREGKI